MSPTRNIKIRPLEVQDFDFVRELAAKQHNFTIPPPYVLWLLLRIKGDICLIAEDERDGPLAYLLAVPIESPRNSIYVWQLASYETDYDQTAVFHLLLKLHEAAKTHRIQSVIFSALADSAEFRVICQHLWKILGKRPLLTVQLPQIVAPDEAEFRVDIN